MVSSLEKPHAVVEHLVHETVYLVHTAVPDIPAHVLQVLGLPDPIVRVAERGLRAAPCLSPDRPVAFAV